MGIASGHMPTTSPQIALRPDGSVCGMCQEPLVTSAGEVVLMYTTVMVCCHKLSTALGYKFQLSCCFDGLGGISSRTTPSVYNKRKPWGKDHVKSPDSGSDHV